MQNIHTRIEQIFWGLAMIGVDLHIHGIDVVPDFAGYFLVAWGAGRLMSLSRQFALVRVLSWILVPVSLGAAVFHGYFGMTLRLLSVPLDGAMMWFLLGGMMEYAASKQRPDLVGRAALCRIAYVCLLCAVGLIGLLARGLPGLASALGTMTFVGMLLVLAVILHLLYQLKRSQPA